MDDRPLSARWYLAHEGLPLQNSGEEFTRDCGPLKSEDFERLLKIICQ